MISCFSFSLLFFSSPKRKSSKTNFAVVLPRTVPDSMDSGHQMTEPVHILLTVLCPGNEKPSQKKNTVVNLFRRIPD